MEGYTEEESADDGTNVACNDNMAYLGGKSRRAQHIISVLNDKAFDGMTYFEPFVGYCHILRCVRKKRRYIAADNNPLLCKLLRHIQSGKSYPSVSREEYKKLTPAPPTGPLTLLHAATAVRTLLPLGWYRLLTNYLGNLHEKKTACCFLCVNKRIE